VAASVAPKMAVGFSILAQALGLSVETRVLHVDMPSLAGRAV
jgi:hypothetical protein